MTDVKNFLDWLAAVFAAAGAVVSNMVTLVAGLFAIAWYTHRFYKLWKDSKNGN